MKDYTFHFDLVGTVIVAADNLDEARDIFCEIVDYSDYVNSYDAYNVVIEEDGNFIEEGDY